MFEEIKDWDWTHKGVYLTDIRKPNEFYTFTVAYDWGEEEYPVLSVKENIFEDRLKSYFLKDPSKVTREEIMSVKWNMYITKGYYIKLHRGKAYPHDMDPNKYYVSYLEIDGLLGKFQSIIFKDKE